MIGWSDRSLFNKRQMDANPQTRAVPPPHYGILKGRPASHDRCACHHAVLMCMDNGLVDRFMQPEVIGIDDYESRTSFFHRVLRGWGPRCHSETANSRRRAWFGNGRARHEQYRPEKARNPSGELKSPVRITKRRARSQLILDRSNLHRPGLLVEPPNHSGRHADRNCPRRNIPRNDTASANDCGIADLHAR